MHHAADIDPVDVDGEEAEQGRTVRPGVDRRVHDCVVQVLPLHGGMIADHNIAVIEPTVGLQPVTDRGPDGIGDEGRHAARRLGDELPVHVHQPDREVLVFVDIGTECRARDVGVDLVGDGNDAEPDDLERDRIDLYGGVRGLDGSIHRLSPLSVRASSARTSLGPDRFIRMIIAEICGPFCRRLALPRVVHAGRAGLKPAPQIIVPCRQGKMPKRSRISCRQRKSSASYHANEPDRTLAHSRQRCLPSSHSPPHSMRISPMPPISKRSPGQISVVEPYSSMTAGPSAANPGSSTSRS